MVVDFVDESFTTAVVSLSVVATGLGELMGSWLAGKILVSSLVFSVCCVGAWGMHFSLCSLSTTLVGRRLHGYHGYTGWPRKNATILIVNFKDIINKNGIDFYFIMWKIHFPTK